MVAILRERAAKEGITNISCVQKRWEDVDIARDLAGPYDIVIASLSLTMEDIRAALEKMDAVSRQYVCLYWFVDLPFWERMYADLWEPLHGTPYYSGPKADCLFDVLYQMGIYPNVEMLPLSKEYRFASRGRWSVLLPAVRCGSPRSSRRSWGIPRSVGPERGYGDRDLREFHVREDLVEEGQVTGPGSISPGHFYTEGAGPIPGTGTPFPDRGFASLLFGGPDASRPLPCVTSMIPVVKP